MFGGCVLSPHSPLISSNSFVQGSTYVLDIDLDNTFCILKYPRIAWVTSKNNLAFAFLICRGSDAF